MSDTATPKVAKPKARKPVKKVADHPTYLEMIITSIAALKERKGSSRQAILKHIVANYKVKDNASTHVKQALKRGVASGALKQVKGTGASGSFKLADNIGKKKAAAKKPAAKKAKKPAAKKPAAKKAKKPAAKKAKKAKKVAAKKPAAKKAKKPAAKKPAAKKPAKKAAKKKAAKK